MKKRYWPIIVLGLLLLPLLIPAPKNILKGITFSPAVTDDSGELLRLFLTDDDKYRMWTDISLYPPEFIEALLLKEDKLFYSHHGVDIPALFRAAYETYVKKQRRVGASTLTMQLVRLKEGVYTKSILGKLKQIYKAIYIDLHYDKQEILEAYLNLAPCGGNIEGFSSASYYYFGKKVMDLTLSEILFLVVLPQNPEVRSPKNRSVPDLTLNARKTLFNQWIIKNPEDKKWELTMDMPINVICKFPFEAPHLTEYIVENYNRDKGSYKTTINITYQKLVEHQLEAYIRHNSTLGVKNGAVLILDHTTNEVVSLIGSRDYFNNEIEGQVKGFNAKRSPGSTLKPFVYAMGIDQGIIHPHTMQKDSPQTFGVYTPDNFESNFKGPVFAWDALVQSKNIPAINLANKISNPDLYDFMKKTKVAGLKERGHYGLSIVLGSAEVTMLELGAMYSTLANDGLYQQSRFLADEELSTKTEVLSPEASYLTLRMLKKNPSPVDYRPKETKEFSIAYKTGTSIGFKDSWSVGVVDDYVVAVWIGNFDGAGNPAFIGSKMAAPLLFSISDALLLEKQPEIKLEKVSRNIKMVPVCAVSGGIPNEYCNKTVLTGFIPGVSPINKCHIHRLIYIDELTGYRTDDINSENTVKEVREVWSSDLLDLFEKAGLPRLKPPPYPPNNKGAFSLEIGYAPKINSPLDGAEYIIRKDSNRHNSIILMASADGDSEKLFWFANDIYLGSDSTKSRLEWFPEPGNYEITVVDEMGRSSSIDISVTY